MHEQMSQRLIWPWLWQISLIDIKRHTDRQTDRHSDIYHYMHIYRHICMCYYMHTYRQTNRHTGMCHYTHTYPTLRKETQPLVVSHHSVQHPSGRRARQHSLPAVRRRCGSKRPQSLTRAGGWATWFRPSHGSAAVSTGVMQGRRARPPSATGYRSPATRVAGWGSSRRQ